VLKDHKYTAIKIKNGINAGAKFITVDCGIKQAC
jgi:hypothetical protein